MCAHTAPLACAPWGREPDTWRRPLWQTCSWRTCREGLPPRWQPGIERRDDLEASLMALGTLLHVGARKALHQGMGRL